jgi:hypothetical protein
MQNQKKTAKTKGISQKFAFNDLLLGVYAPLQEKPGVFLPEAWHLKSKHGIVM